MSNFSVKKPYTVFVGVVIVILLGVISFMNLSTDLLPNMELPYVAIITTYVGASPEKVEESVSKVIEQGMMGISNIKSVSSNSSENYSMVLLEFSGESNMDSVMIEISQELDVIEASLEDGVATPIVMQINPDMMPVLMTAIDMKDASNTEVTNFVKEKIKPELESVDGVATVDTYGEIEEQILIKLDQEKIDKVNDKVLKNVSSELAKAKRKLNDAQEEINKGKAELESTKTEKTQEIADGIAAVESGRNEITKAEIELATKETEVINTKIELEGQLNTLINTENELVVQKDGLAKQLVTVLNQKAEVQTQMAILQETKSVLEQKQAQGELTEDENAELVDIVNQLGAFEVSIFELDRGAGRITEAISQIDASSLEISAGKMQLTSGLDQVNAGISQLAEAKNTINTKKAELDKTASTLQVAQSMLVSETTKASTQLESAEKELKAGLEQFESARDEAYKNASLDGIITVDMVSNILKAENFSMPAGYINDDIIVKVGEKFSSIDEIKDLLLFSFDIKGLEEVKLQDLASVEFFDNSDKVYTKLNENNGLILSFSKQSTSSTKDVSAAVQKKLEELGKKYDNVSFTNLMDQGIYIDMIIGSVMQSLVYGGIFAIVVLFLFLKALKPTIIVAVSIPISLVFAIAMMYFSGVSLNIMSLSGLALGVGMLVDNSIVVIENIFRLKKEGREVKEAAEEGARKVTGAIIASTLTTVCVFLPIVFIQGISRQLFADIGLTIAYSLLASLIVALTVVPAMASKMLRSVNEKENKFINRVTIGYSKILDKALKYKVVVFSLVIVLLGGSIYLTTKMEIEFVPSVASDQMSLSVEMPKEATHEEMVNTCNTIIDRLLTIDSIWKIGAMDMSSGTSVLGGSDGITMYLLLNTQRALTNNEIADKIKDLTGDLNCEVEVSTSDMDMSSMMGSGVSVKIAGNDLDKLKEIGTDIENKLREIDGIGEIEGVSQKSTPEKRIEVNKNKAMEYGLTVAQVYQEVASRLSKEVESTKVQLDAKEYQLIIQKPDSDLVNLDNLMNVKFKATKNQKEVTIKLSDFANIVEATSLESISREDNNRYITISATIADDASTTQVSREAQKMLENYEMPTGYKIVSEGELESVMEYIRDLILMIFVAVIFIYLIMVSQFQSFKLPFIVMFTIPLAFTGGLLALFFTNQSINIIAMLGFLVLAGIVVNNGIVFIDSINQLREEGMDRRDAIIVTGKLRLRPILMTALTTILGLLMMALGIGQGSEMTQPLGIVAIGGLLYSTLLTLFLVPCLYDMLCKKA